MPPVYRRHKKRAIFSYLLMIVLTAGVLFFVCWLHISSDYTAEPVILASEIPAEQPEQPDPFEQIDPPDTGLDPEKPMVALTFNDCVTELTLEFVDVLTEHGCEATFYTVGYLAEKQPDIFRGLLESGMEIGNHSYSHKQLVGLSLDSAARQFGDAQKLFNGYSGTTGTSRSARPPYGRLDETVLEAAGKCGMPVVLWSVDPQDAGTETPEELCSRVMEKVSDGDIIVLHDGLKNTLEALPALLEQLTGAGYQVTTVEKLFASHGYGLKAGYCYDRLP